MDEFLLQSTDKLPLFKGTTATAKDDDEADNGTTENDGFDEDIEISDEGSDSDFDEDEDPDKIEVPGKCYCVLLMLCITYTIYEK